MSASLFSPRKDHNALRSRLWIPGGLNCVSANTKLSAGDIPCRNSIEQSQGHANKLRIPDCMDSVSARSARNDVKFSNLMKISARIRGQQ